ncbi:MAG TPA: lytic murein transglycosylase, partial [Solirubrobacterales bacterium]|nr:lytic murein transglycosylase [Solirubrobacterales bacterium]
MRDKLALTIALAGFAAATALGVGIAGAEESTGLGESRATGPLGPAQIAPATPAAGCANGVDDDGDGLVDSSDPGCESAADADEVDPAPVAEPEDDGSPAPAPGGVEEGASLDPADSKSNRAGGVARNDELGSPVVPAGSSGAVTAPPATAGDQPAAHGPDGGSAFSDGGTPTAANPSTTIAPFGPAPIGVPNIVIDSFEIPPFLLPIYQACGTQYGVPWQVLASINKIETAFGTNLNVSSAGAMGWMQFIPSSWEAYGVDANGDGRKDPYNPVDAICAAGNYLKAAGAHEDLYSAIFAYNHADWYVQEVLLYARAYGKLPADLVGSLTGLTE